MFFSPILASMMGSENITFSPVFKARCSSRMRLAGTPPATISGLITAHSDSAEPAVTPPETIARRNSPSRHNRHAVSARKTSSTRVPNRNSRSAALSGVWIRCFALISAISAALGNRCDRSSILGQQPRGNVGESINQRPVASEEAADLPAEQRGKGEQEQRARKFARDQRANEQRGHADREQDD